MSVSHILMVSLLGVMVVPTETTASEFGPKPTIEQVEALLAATPPTTADHAARVKTIRAIDALFDTTEVAKDPAIIEFYRRRVEAGLAALKAGPPPGHARIVKLYSSSTVIKTADGCFTFDFAEGPCGDTWGLPEATDDEFRNFHLTDEQRDRLAKLLDVYFITHRHHDHVSFALCERMARLGKPIIAPPESKAWFKRGKAPFAEAIQTPAPDAVHTLGKLSFVHYAGVQYMEWIEDDHERPVKDSPKNVPNNCYLVRLSGMTFGHCGDNRDAGHVEWARQWSKKGWRPDVSFALGIGKFTKLLARAWGGLRIHVHDYEFRHTNFNRLSWWLDRRPVAWPKRRPVLFWGEHLDVPLPSASDR